MYSNNTDRVCYACSSNCETCAILPNRCLSCYFNLGFYYYNYVCYNPCPMDTYLSAPNCFKCAPNCLTCDMIATNCTSCDMRFYSYLSANHTCIYCDPALNQFYNPGNYCEICTIVGCLQCMTMAICMTCNTAINYTINLTNMQCFYNPPIPPTPPLVPTNATAQLVSIDI